MENGWQVGRLAKMPVLHPSFPEVKASANLPPTCCQPFLRLAEILPTYANLMPTFSMRLAAHFPE
jgi:hypothetical protein